MPPCGTFVATPAQNAGMIVAMKTRLGTAALFAAIVVALAGCMRMEVDTQIYSDNTMDMSMVVAMDESLVNAAGEGANPILEQYQTPEFTDQMDSLGVTYHVTEYHQDKYVGATITFDRAPLDKLQATGDAAGSALGVESGSLVRDGDYFVYTVPVSSVSDSLEGSGYSADQLADSFEYTVAVTFPGAIVEHSAGQVVDDNQFVLDFTDLTTATDDIVVRAWAIDGKGIGGLGLSPLVLGVIGAAVLLAIAAVVVVMLARRRAAEGDDNGEPPAAGRADGSVIYPE